MVKDTEVIIIIMPMLKFMVLSSWQSHCESSPGSFDECRTAPSGRRPSDQAKRLLIVTNDNRTSVTSNKGAQMKLHNYTN